MQRTQPRLSAKGTVKQNPQYRLTQFQFNQPSLFSRR